MRRFHVATVQVLAGIALLGIADVWLNLSTDDMNPKFDFGKVRSEANPFKDPLKTPIERVTDPPHQP
jgi:hypothetical protein